EGSEQRRPKDAPLGEKIRIWGQDHSAWEADASTAMLGGSGAGALKEGFQVFAADAPQSPQLQRGQLAATQPSIDGPLPHEFERLELADRLRIRPTQIKYRCRF